MKIILSCCLQIEPEPADQVHAQLASAMSKQTADANGLQGAMQHPPEVDLTYETSSHSRVRHSRMHIAPIELQRMSKPSHTQATCTALQHRMRSRARGCGYPKRPQPHSPTRAPDRHAARVDRWTALAQCPPSQCLPRRT